MVGLELNSGHLLPSEWVPLTNVLEGFWYMDNILEKKYVCRYGPGFIFRAVVSQLSCFTLLPGKDKRFKWTPTFAEHVYTNHFLQHLWYRYRYFTRHTEKWNAKEGDKASTKIEILIFSHSSVVGPVYALCYWSTCLETVLGIEVHYVVGWMFQADISHLILLPFSSREQFALVLSLTFTVWLWSCSTNLLVAKLYLEWMVIMNNNDWECVIVDKGMTWGKELNQINCVIFNWLFFLIILLI